MDITLVQTEAGRKYTYVGRRSRRQVDTLIDREWDVLADGVIIGRIEYRLVTRETRSAGCRYVNSRWESPGWMYNDDPTGHRWYMFEGWSKKDCVERIVREAERERKAAAR